MIDLIPLSSILFVHWVFDFCLQTHWQATNKSKNNIALLNHVATYSFGLTLIMCINASYFSSVQSAVTFVVANAAAHFATDYVTSRISSALYAKGEYHDFFAVVGFDQLIHYFTLIFSFLALTR